MALLFLICIGACQHKNKPDLERLYHLNRHSSDTSTPLILIHGILGSKLRYKDSLSEIWPDNVRKLVFSKYKDLAFEIDSKNLSPDQSNQESFNILDTIQGFSIYQEIIDTLVNYGQYQLTSTDETYSTGRKLYVFHYDWRQDNVKSAQQLDAFIKKIQAKNPHVPKQKVDIVAHSMGGLITRYYMRYGTVDVLNNKELQPNLEGAKNIRKAVFLGTPNLGVILSVNRLVNGYKFGIRTIPIEVMMTMPSIYQMLPHSDVNWLVDLMGSKIKLDIYDVNTWRKLKWAIFDPEVRNQMVRKEASLKMAKQKIKTLEKFFEKSLNRAKQFSNSLSINIENEAHDFIMMGGDCERTPARLVMEKIKEQYLLRTFPSQISQKIENVDYEKIMLEPGDGHVTKSSLLARIDLDPSKTREKTNYVPIKYKILLCENHRTLTSNIAFQDNLLDILLSDY